MKFLFYDRYPWNMIIGVLLVVLIVVGIANATSWWVILALLGLMVAHELWLRARRIYGLATVGYHADWFGRSRLRYTERNSGTNRSLVLDLANTEPGHFELFVPNEATWRQVVPGWAKDRRSEISGRIAQTWRPQDVHLES